MDIQLLLDPENGPNSRPTKRKSGPAFSDSGTSEDPQSNIDTKRQRRGHGALCRLCGKVDFHEIFRPRAKPQSPHYRLPKLIKMLENTECPLCSLIVSCISDEIGQGISKRRTGDISIADTILERFDLEPRLFERLRCSISFGLGNEDLYLRTKDVDIAGRAKVRFWVGRRTKFKIYLDKVETNAIASKSASSEPYIMVRRPLSNRPFDPELLRRWLDEGDQISEQAKKKSVLPSRLTPLLDEGRLKVIDTQTGLVMPLPNTARYVALSYVWGKAWTCPLRALEDSSSDVISANPNAPFVDRARFPQSIRDACVLVRTIGEQYLWVDAICIDQSDPADKHANISQMGAIYENAYFTIIAASGEDADAGLSRLRSGNVSEFPLRILQTQSTMLLPTRRTIAEILHETTWSMRAWTFQERSLSPRYVAFTHDEVLFHCPDFESREAYELIPNWNHSKSSVHRRWSTRKQISYDTRLSTRKPLTFKHYCEALREYSERELTYAGDRLDAFTGIHERFHPQGLTLVRKQALSGLHMKFFLRTLAWDFTQLPAERRKPTRICLDARKSRYLPSWSWAGWRGKVRVYPVRYKGKTDAQVLDAANIVCFPCGKDCKEELELQEVTHPLCVSLHMLALTICCHWEACDHGWDQGDWIMSISKYPQDKGPDRIILGRVSDVFDFPLMADADPYLDLYLISLESSLPVSFLLVEGLGNSMKRLALLRFNSYEAVCQIKKFMIERYLRLT